MSRPWMAFYPTNYLAKTMHLSTFEHGVYLLLIIHYWEHKGLPNDEKKLARITRTTPEEWAEVRETMAEFFTKNWKHEKIEKEIEKAEKIYQSRVEAGRKGGKSFTKPPKKQSLSPAKAKRNQLQLHKKDKPKTVYQKKISPYFETFWKAYPRKTARGAAGKAYTAALKRATPQEILEGVERFAKAREGEDKNFTAHGSTWLNSDRWLDEEIPKVVPDTRTNGSGVWIRKGSRQWLAWEQHGRRNNDDKMLFSMDCVEEGGERKFLAEWPSGLNG